MTNTETFSGQVALLTGAGSGIGRNVAQHLTAGGATIVGVDLNADGLAETADLLPHGMTSIVADVSDPATCADVVRQAVEAHGRLDILGNIAGVSWGKHFTDETPESFRKMVGVNVEGVFFMTQAAIPHLIESRGAIVSIASAAALMGQAYTVLYSMTKAAVVAMTKGLAMEYMKSGVRINAIAPGGIRTPMTAGFSRPENMDPDVALRYHPIRGVGEVDDIGAMFTYLVSPAAQRIHGAVFSVDNGQITG